MIHESNSSVVRRRKPPLRPVRIRAIAPKQAEGEDEEHLKSLRLACRWLIERATVRSEALPTQENIYDYPYRNWRGALREYDARARKWQVFGPLWHTGQAVKALVMAFRVTGDRNLLDAAIRSADFVLHTQIADPADPRHGLIHAFENGDSGVSATSCMLESLDGLIELGQETGDDRYLNAAVACLQWTRREMFLREEGLFLDDFILQTSTAVSAPNTLRYGVPGRPLNDDGVFLRGYHLGGDQELRDVFFAVTERLLRDENPQGNWVNYPPCDPSAKLLHPRHAFWWGRPMVMAWEESGDERYLACAKRCGDWYVHAQRSDGGMFRATDVEFMTPSFGHATSGILAACCLWRDLIATGHGDAYREPLRRALAFGRAMQFTNPADENLTGSILEKVDLPDGTDRPPYLVRDLGTIFYVQALAGALGDGLLVKVSSGKPTPASGTAKRQSAPVHHA